MAGSPGVQLRSRLGWSALLATLTIEAFLLVWVLLVTVLGALGSSGSYAQNGSLVVMAAVSLAWVVATLAGAVKSKASWVRGSALTIHVLLFAAGTGCLQLDIGPWWFGFGLVALALIGFLAAILARPATAPESEPPGAEMESEPGA